MTALREHWQTQRQQRQEEVMQRRAAVMTDLQTWQQTRQQQGDTLRQQLTQFHAALQAETDLFLAQAHQQHQAQARRTQAELLQFHRSLHTAVMQARQAMQAELAALTAATQEQLAGYGRDRAVLRNRQAEELKDYVDDLIQTVASYLEDVSLRRQQAAVQDRAQRQRDRAALTDEVQALCDDFSVFRAQMKTYRENLRQSVWGSASPVAPPPIAAEPAMPRLARRSRPKSVSIPVMVPPVAPAPVKNGQPGQPVAEVPIEEAVYDYLQGHNAGARLTEIESTLGINRFQAVDALRSLIQKELIVQRDRTYHIHEEAVL